jgi:hypothetical protein
MAHCICFVPFISILFHFIPFYSVFFRFILFYSHLFSFCFYIGLPAGMVRVSCGYGAGMVQVGIDV